MKGNIDWRTLSIIAGATCIGALWAGYNLLSAGDARDQSVYRALIWAVFATPLATFIGWLRARPREVWRAALFCFAIYFFSMLAAARIERFVLGEEVAAATQHALYFRLCIALDVLGGLAVALRQSRSIGTIAETERSG